MTFIPAEVSAPASELLPKGCMCFEGKQTTQKLKVCCARNIKTKAKNSRRLSCPS